MSPVNNTHHSESMKLRLVRVKSYDYPEYGRAQARFDTVLFKLQFYSQFLNYFIH